ncbi:MAG: hypothetical protein AAFV90_15945 [Cyanobacteria bacterium J06634_5]
MSSILTSPENKSPFYQKFRSIALTMLGLGIGYLLVLFSNAFLYTTWLRGEGHTITSQFLAFAAIWGVVCAAIAGYVVGLVAQRRPVIHATLFALMLTLSYLLPSLLFGFYQPALAYVLNIAIAISGSMIGGWLRYWQMSQS